MGTVRIRKALENKSNMEDDRVAILEAQLAQAKLIAEEADKKYEEVGPLLLLHIAAAAGGGSGGCDGGAVVGRCCNLAAALSFALFLCF